MIFLKITEWGGRAPRSHVAAIPSRRLHKFSRVLIFCGEKEKKCSMYVRYAGRDSKPERVQKGSARKNAKIDFFT